MNLPIVALLVALSQVAAEPEDYGYKCIYKEIHGKTFRKCGKIIPPTHYWYCIPQKFTDHNGIKHTHKLCNVFPIDIKVNNA